MTTRKHIPLRTKLAAALLTMRRVDETGKLVPVIPHEHAKQMSVDQVLSLFEWHHHPIPKAPPFNGPDEHWNLQPELIMEHREETHTVTRPVIRKTRRLAEEQEEFRRKVLQRPCGAKREKSTRWPRRPFRRKP